jgi:hypothetical protein
VITRTALERDVVIVACAISAGVHAALAPAHFAEGAGGGLGFVTAAVVLACLVVALTPRPASSELLAGAAVALTGLLVGYALATTTGLPLLHPETEPADGLAVFTKAVELIGLLAATHLLWHGGPALGRALRRPKGKPRVTTRTNRPIPLALTMLIGLFSALAALAVSGGTTRTRTRTRATMPRLTLARPAANEP